MATTSILQATKATNNTAATSHAFPMGVTTAYFSTLYLFVACVTKTQSVTGVTDSASNANWVSLGGAGDATQGNVYCWMCAKSQPITTLTVSYSGSTKTQLGFLEVNGLFFGLGDTSGPTPWFSPVTTMNQTVVSTNNAHNFMVAACSTVPVVNSVAAPFTLLTGASGGGAGLQLGVAWDEEYALGTYNANFTIASAAVGTTFGASTRLSELPPKPRRVPNAVVRSFSY